MAFPPGKVNTDEANSSHMAGCTAPLTWRGGDKVIAYVDLAVRDDPPVVLYPCGAPPARVSPAIGPS
jgi:hypothetical protein